MNPEASPSAVEQLARTRTATRSLRPWHTGEIDTFVNWLIENQNEVIRGRPSHWASKAKEEIFRDDEGFTHINTQKLKDKFHNMKKAWKEAKDMQAKMGCALTEAECNPLDSEKLEKRCTHFWKVDAVLSRDDPNSQQFSEASSNHNPVADAANELVKITETDSVQNVVPAPVTSASFTVLRGNIPNLPATNTVNIPVTTPTTHIAPLSASNPVAVPLGKTANVPSTNIVNTPARNAVSASVTNAVIQPTKSIVGKPVRNPAIAPRPRPIAPRLPHLHPHPHPSRIEHNINQSNNPNNDENNEAEGRERGQNSRKETPADHEKTINDGNRDGLMEVANNLESLKRLLETNETHREARENKRIKSDVDIQRYLIDAETRRAEILAKSNERMAEIQARSSEKVAEMQARSNEKISEMQQETVRLQMRMMEACLKLSNRRGLADVD